MFCAACLCFFGQPGFRDLSLPRKLGLEVGGCRVVYILRELWQAHCDAGHTTQCNATLQMSAAPKCLSGM